MRHYGTAEFRDEHGGAPGILGDKPEIHRERNRQPSGRQPLYPPMGVVSGDHDHFRDVFRNICVDFSRTRKIVEIAGMATLFAAISITSGVVVFYYWG